MDKIILYTINDSVSANIESSVSEKITNLATLSTELSTNEIKMMPCMKRARAYHSVKFLGAFKSILVVGGENNATTELYDLNTSRWRLLPDLKYPRSNCCLHLDKSSTNIYACFGISSNILSATNAINSPFVGFS